MNETEIANQTQTEPSTTTPETTESKSASRRGEINRDYLLEISASRKVGAAALDEAHAPALAKVELDPKLPGQINDLVLGIGNKISWLKSVRTTKKTMSAQEIAARKALIAVIQPIQTAAKRKFSGDTTTQREAYYVGQGLGSQTLDEVLAAGRNILSRLVPAKDEPKPQDVLPGVKADGAIKDLADAIAEYGGKEVALDGQQIEAEKVNEAIAAGVQTLASLRRQIQLAADQAWPWRTKGVAAIRKAFLLPADRPVKE